MSRTARYIVAALTVATLATALPAMATDPSSAARPARTYTLVNRTFDSVTAFAVAPVGGGEFDNVVLGEALQGGLTSATVHMPAGDCRRDIRVTFRDQHQETFTGIDVCRSSGLRLTATGGTRGRTIQAEQLSQVDKPGL